ncbi:SEC-C metal-binding domain-containing protein [Actinoplanes sp. NPDC051851]|uniref:SEC-C metal-binding domain-containing protein n=1 Tax=Actinoplanes sp. NPDC051851 TaxID=3154753 RepID=UPI003446502F
MHRSTAKSTLEISSTGNPTGCGPGRPSACWCDSGRKYKKCCAAPAQEATRPRI